MSPATVMPMPVSALPIARIVPRLCTVPSPFRAAPAIAAVPPFEVIVVSSAVSTLKLPAEMLMVLKLREGRSPVLLMRA